MSDKHKTQEVDPECFSSSPCMMHELDAETLGFTQNSDEQTCIDITRWRKAERARLIAERMKISAHERTRMATEIGTKLNGILDDLDGRLIGVYWPMHGEPDLRPWMEYIRACGAVCSLPVVVERKAPLLFRTWRPDRPLEKGVAGIPIPADGDPVIPDVLVVPMIGFDRKCHRLGYGGGYYDCTLASLANRPRVIGIEYSQTTLHTIHPQPHDILMDVVITECETTFRTITC